MMTTHEERFDTVIVGLGKTGLSYARYLQRQGQVFAVTDNRVLSPEMASFRQEFPSVKLVNGGFDQTLLLNSRQILMSPGISLQEPAIKEATKVGAEIVGDIELFCQAVKAPIIAVTGSNGKSTVVSLVHTMAQQAGLNAYLGGNIGIPVLDLLSRSEPDLYVLELSSFQLELTHSLNAATAVVLNISEDHMDRYADVSDYVQSKSKIYAGSGVMVINLDDPQVVGMRQAGRKQIGFTGARPEVGQFGLREILGSLWLMRGGTRLLDTRALKIHGRHNYLNALAALALGEAVALPQLAMLTALKNFHGLSHRCEFVRSIHGVSWYNDSKGTNVGASCAAIESLAGRNNLILIAGGEGKDADFAPLRDAVRDRVKWVITIGHDGPVIAGVLQGVVTTTAAGSLDAAVAMAHQEATKGDIVLLSPACASLDMFDDYAERGRCFMAAVKALREAS